MSENRRVVFRVNERGNIYHSGKGWYVYHNLDAPVNTFLRNEHLGVDAIVYYDETTKEPTRLRYRCFHGDFRDWITCWDALTKPLFPIHFRGTTEGVSEWFQHQQQFDGHDTEESGDLDRGIWRFVPNESTGVHLLLHFDHQGFPIALLHRSTDRHWELCWNCGFQYDVRGEMTT